MAALVTTLRVAVPPETCAVPRTLSPTWKSTFPVIVPAVPEVTVAVSTVVPYIFSELGEAATVVLVAAPAEVFCQFVYSA